MDEQALKSTLIILCFFLIWLVKFSYLFNRSTVKQFQSITSNPHFFIIQLTLQSISE